MVTATIKGYDNARRRKLTMPDRIDQIAALLREAGHAHHQAFLDTDGYDPDWPAWYANHLTPRLPALLEAELPQSELASLLLALDQQLKDSNQGAHWADYYAQELHRRYPNTSKSA
jgi:hypothetical protein